MKKHNYNAGPCILPQEVFEEASKAILNFNNSQFNTYPYKMVENE